MATVQLSPIGGAAAQFFTDNGVPLSGGKIYTYAAGTSTPQATYTTAAGNVQHSNPIVLDAAGRVPTGEIWVIVGLSYKFALKDLNDVLIATYDNILVDVVNNADQIEYDPPFTGAVTSNYTVQDKLSQYVSVKDFGATGDGVTNDTVAIQAALSSGRSIYFPNGIYKTTTVTIPSNIEVFGESQSNAIISPIGSIDTITANGKTNIYIHDLTIGGSSNGITLYTTTNSLIQNVTVGDSVGTGIYIRECSNVTIDKCTVGATDLYHCVQDDMGYKNTISNCYITGGHIFGVSAFNSSYTNILNNRIQDTLKEAINLQDSTQCTVDGNTCTWGSNISTDFGISLWGEPPSKTCNFNIVTNNFVSAPNKSGIALADRCQYNSIQNNTITNPNSLLESSAGGIALYGTGCTGNAVIGNTVFDNQNYLTQCYVDLNSDGYNRFFSNTAFSSSGTNGVFKNTTQVALTVSGMTGYTPTVTSFTGTITSYTSAGEYMRVGNLVFVTIKVNLTNAGTAGNALYATLPFQAAGSLVSFLVGRNSVDGAMIQGSINVSSSRAEIYFYNNNSVCVTGNDLYLSGFYMAV